MAPSGAVVGGISQTLTGEGNKHACNTRYSWFGFLTLSNQKPLVRIASKMIGVRQAQLQDIYFERLENKAQMILIIYIYMYIFAFYHLAALLECPVAELSVQELFYSCCHKKALFHALIYHCFSFCHWFLIYCHWQINGQVWWGIAFL